MTDLIGNTIKGYEFRTLLGTGTFGAVYRAYQPVIGREVAVKVILPHFANRPEFIRLFETEAQLVARLEHPHIVPLFDYWREPDSAYIVMRLLPNSLRLALKEITFDPEIVVKIVEQLCSALSLFHQQDIVHRDIKPDNIMLDDSMNVYLSDFGLAKMLWDTTEPDDEGVTGSPPYMAPEQIRGEALTPQTDIYALGIIIYELLAGKHPYAGTKLSTMLAKHLKEELPPLPVFNAHQEPIPQNVNAIIARATAKEPHLRYKNVLEIAQDLRQAMLGNFDMDATMEMPVAIVKNPYKGLHPFEEIDSGDFYGRESIVGEILARLVETSETNRLLAIVGPSGSGKSSLVKAGVLPALRQGTLSDSERWYIASMTPGTNPFERLESALLSIASTSPDNLIHDLKTDPRGLVKAVNRLFEEDEGQIVLFIDQFEEIFTLVVDETIRNQFIQLLVKATLDSASRIRIILTLRADFYDRPLHYDEFGRIIQQQTQVVLPLSRNELERAIVMPSQRVGVRVDPKLVTSIVADVREEPGALPLLQYTLTELFERREGAEISISAYQDLGGVAGALATRAEEVFALLDADQRLISRQLFLRLVTLGEGTEDIRRRALRSELMSLVNDAEQLETILGLFGRHRLLSFDHDSTTREPTVEVAHEALIRVWQRLKNWVSESRNDVRQQRRLNELAEEWLNYYKDGSYLLHGLQLQQFEAWIEHSTIDLTEEELEYLQTSVDKRHEEERLETERLEHERRLEARARTFLRGLVVVISVALIISFVLAMLAFSERSEAQDARQEAEDNAHLSQTQAAIADTSARIAQTRADSLQSLSLTEAGEDAIQTNRFDVGLALILEANLIENAPLRSEQSIYDNAPNSASNVLRGHNNQVNAVAVNSDYILSGDSNGVIIVWDIETDEQISRFNLHSGKVQVIAISPDGRHALSGDDNNAVLYWDIQTGEVVYYLLRHEGDILDLAISPDGTWAVTASRDQTLIQWDLVNGTMLRQLTEGHTNRVTSVAISPDGEYLVSGSSDQKIILWDAERGNLLEEFTSHNDAIVDFAFSHDGTRFLSFSSDNTLVLWDAEKWTEIYRRSIPNVRLTSVAFSSNRDLAVLGSGSPFAGDDAANNLLMWDVNQGQQISAFRGHSLQITDVAFLPNDNYIVSASSDTSLRLWPVNPLPEYWDLTSHARITAFANYGDHILVATYSTAEQVLNETSSEEIYQFMLWQYNGTDETPTEIATFGQDYHSGEIHAVALTNKYMLSASEDRQLILWDLETLMPIHKLVGHTNQVNTIAFLPDGEHAISGSQDRTLILWDLATGEAIRTFEALHTNSIDGIAINAAGTQVISASADRSLIVWNIQTGESVLRLRGHNSGVVDVTFSRDGQTAFSASQDQSIIHWDLSTGQPITIYEGHSDRVEKVVLSDDQWKLLSISRDQTLGLWDLNTTLSEPVARVSYSQEVLIGASFVTNDIAIIASAEGEIALIPVSTEAFIQWLAENRYIYTLSCEERLTYLLEACPTDPVE